MFYTHFNLSGLRLESVQIPPLHARENGVLTLHFSTRNSQGNFFIRPYFKSQLLSLSHPEATFRVNAGQKSEMQLAITGQKRGKEVLQSVYIESLFPFNFFRCFTFFKIHQNLFVYPERENLHLHEELELNDDEQSEGDDFYLRDYVPGDSLKRVDWKKLAQTNRWYTRQFQAAKPHPVMLIDKQRDLEGTLKSMCFALHSLHQQDIKYGLQLGADKMIAPAHSPAHLDRCLKELAAYEA